MPFLQELREALFGPPPPPLPPGHWEFSIKPSQTEVFTPGPLLTGMVYKFIFTGAFRYDWHGIFLSHDDLADVAYEGDPFGNYVRRYDGIFVNGQSVWKGEIADSWEENRPQHRYSFLVDGTGQQISIRLPTPRDSGNARSPVTVQIKQQPPGTILVSERFAADGAIKRQAELAEQQRKADEALQKQLAEEAEQQRHEQEMQQTLAAAKAAKAQAEQVLRQQIIQSQVMQYRQIVRFNQNFLDPQFRDAFVRQHQQEILTTLRSKWEHEHRGLMADQEVVAILQQQAPEVIEFHERRLDMIMLAERLDIIPATPQVNISLPVPITDRTIGTVENLISELFRTRDQYDHLQKAMAQNGPSNQYRNQLQQALRLMAFDFEQLKRFGIYATTPEEAEQKFRVLCPCEPVPTLYEEIQEQIKAGQPVSMEAIRERLEDIHREKITRSGQRRAAVRAGDMEEIKSLDDRLAAIRRESTALKDFLEQRGEKVEFKDYREREDSIADQFFRLYHQQQNVMSRLTAPGDDETKDHVKALYAEQIQKLFNQNSESYT